MVNRLRTTLVACAALTLAALTCLPAANAATLGSWNRSEQQKVARAGVLPNASHGAFHGERHLTADELRVALAALGASRTTVPVSVPKGALTVVRFDALLVKQLGLADAAAAVESQAVGAGLHPPVYFGSEVVARMLGLRYNHPAGQDSLELYPTDAITRAEAAHSFAVILALSDWQTSYARQELSSFRLPHYTAAQRTVLSLAVSKIGMPYVWGGTSDDTSDGLAHGGYDCSGFVWRVYKLSGLPWGRQIGGRTAAQQSAEIPSRRRIRIGHVEPGDLLFFGSAHFSSRVTAANISHEGIALSGQWVIHSSDQGVYVLPLTNGWLHDSFAWARRIL